MNETWIERLQSELFNIKPSSTNTMLNQQYFILERYEAELLRKIETLVNKNHELTTQKNSLIERIEGMKKELIWKTSETRGEYVQKIGYNAALDDVLKIVREEAT